MDTRPLVDLDVLGSGDADGIALGFDPQIRLLHARHFGDDYDIVAFAKYVQGRVGTAAAWPGLKPIAGAQRVERLLELKQRVERVRKENRHDEASCIGWRAEQSGPD